MFQKTLPNLHIQPVLTCFFAIVHGLCFVLYFGLCPDSVLADDSSQPAVSHVETPSETKEDFTLPPEPFTRLTRNADGELHTFETSLVTFVSPDGTSRVTLIGAIHIGEKNYYRTLNQKFTAFDCVLFEMVTDGDPRPTDARQSGGIIGTLQRLGAVLLDLDFQIGSINYYAPNFVHADMTNAEFLAAQERRKDGLLVWFSRSLAYESARRQDCSVASDLLLLKLLFEPNRRRTLRRLYAPSISELDASIIPVDGKNGSSILTDRNTKVLEILKSQLEGGMKNIAIFYGAAHLPQLAEKIQTEFHYKPEKIEWLTCWKLD